MENNGLQYEGSYVSTPVKEDSLNTTCQPEQYLDHEVESEKNHLAHSELEDSRNHTESDVLPNNFATSSINIEAAANEQHENGEQEMGMHLEEFYDMSTLGTEYQKVIVKDYPMNTSEWKLKVPYIERFNGNLSVQMQKYE